MGSTNQTSAGSAKPWFDPAHIAALHRKEEAARIEELTHSDEAIVESIAAAEEEALTLRVAHARAAATGGPYRH